jgi:non-ribosomal peptide synthetase component F
MLARQMDTTLFTVLCAGWSLLLQRLSGQADFVVGIGSANRQHPGLERVVGFFVNTLPLRIVANERMTVRELLWALKQSTLAAYAHQELPFERIAQLASRSLLSDDVGVAELSALRAAVA